jgi:adenine C2-methylase RlmN of 23S rRNA A2503 and tRNA A37
MIKPVRSFYLPSGRVIVSKTEDGHYIESTEMRDVTVDGKNHEEVRETLDPQIIWKHLAPIEKKWLCTVSTQVGCTYSCKFCDVAKIGFKRNLDKIEILDQIGMLLKSTPEIANGTTKAKIGFARMGEPMQNLENVLDVINMLSPNNKIMYRHVSEYLNVQWLPCFNSIVPKKIKMNDGTYITGLNALTTVIKEKEENHDGYMHIQISVNSTDEEKRQFLFNGADVTPVEDIIKLVNNIEIHNRTITFNFICMKDMEVSVDKLMKWNLNPEKFAVKIIPLNTTLNATKNVLETEFDYRNLDKMYNLAESFKEKGIPVVADSICKAESAGLCCGSLVRQFWPTDKII